MGNVLESNKVFNKKVSKYRKKFLTDTESVKDASKSGRHVLVPGKAKVSKVWVINDIDDTFCQSRKLHILKRILKVPPKICRMDNAYIDR